MGAIPEPSFRAEPELGTTGRLRLGLIPPSIERSAQRRPNCPRDRFMVHANRPGSPLNVLVAASEVVGFAKTGGLADVAGSLPRALARRGHQVAVVMPLYNEALASGRAIEKTGVTIPVPMGDRVLACRLFRSKLPNSDVPVYLIEHRPYFQRDDKKAGRGLYTQRAADGGQADYWDNGERFTFLCRAIMETAPHVGFAPDIIHAND